MYKDQFRIMRKMWFDHLDTKSLLLFLRHKNNQENKRFQNKGCLVFSMMRTIKLFFHPRFILEEDK